MPRNDTPAPSQVCPGIRIQAIDIVQPPGIGMSPIADIESHQTTVTKTLMAKRSAETPTKARWETRSEAMCLKIRRSPAVTVMLMVWISSWYTRRDGATTFRPSRRVPPRFDPSEHGQAIGTYPRGH